MRNKNILIYLFIIVFITIIAAFIITAGINEKEEANKNNINNKPEMPIEEPHVQLKGIQNILLIGVDEGGFDNARSDVMIVATINDNDKTLKFTSIMRDTLSYIPKTDNYQKLNHSYMLGGATETVNAINQNLDLDIKDYVVFDYNAVKKASNFVGGYPTVLTNGEAKDMGIPEGEHILKDDDVVNYMRVRYNSGGDSGRNKRQRDLMFYILEQVKTMDKLSQLKFATQMLQNVRTSYSIGDIKELLNIYNIIKDDLTAEEYSYPFSYQGKRLTDNLWYVVPQTVESNVAKLHEVLFNNEAYTLTSNLNKINEYVNYQLPKG